MNPKDEAIRLLRLALVEIAKLNPVAGSSQTDPAERAYSAYQDTSNAIAWLEPFPSDIVQD